MKLFVFFYTRIFIFVSGPGRVVDSDHVRIRLFGNINLRLIWMGTLQTSIQHGLKQMKQKIATSPHLEITVFLHM